MQDARWQTRRLQLRRFKTGLPLPALTLLAVLFSFTACGPADEAAAWKDDPSARPWFRDSGWFNQGQLALDRQVKNMLKDSNYVEEPVDVIGILVPHAGFAFSGKTAAEAYKRIRIPDQVLLLTPKHHTEGEPVAIWNDGPFLIPGHALHVNQEMMEDLRQRFDPPLEHDRDAWLNENNHPMEMQLPFLSYINPEVEIIPVTFTDDLHKDFRGFDQARIETWGGAVADFILAQREKGIHVLIVASTDLIHHQSISVSDAQDPVLMENVATSNVDGLYKFVVDEGITICGEIPTSILMSAAKKLGGRGELVARTTSGDENGNFNSVVGYGSVVFWMQ